MWVIRSSQAAMQAWLAETNAALDTAAGEYKAYVAEINGLDGELKIAVPSNAGPVAGIAELKAAVEESSAEIVVAETAVQDAVEKTASVFTMSSEEILASVTATSEAMLAAMQGQAAAAEEQAGVSAEEAAAFNAAVQTKIDAQIRLNTAFAAGLGSTSAITEAESALDEAMAAGAVTAAEYSSYVGKLDASEIELAASTAGATAAVEANTGAIVLNSRAAAEVGILMGELASGNASRMKRSFAALANQTGLLQQAVSFIFSPLGLLSVAIAGVAYEAFEAGQKFDAMEGTVLATGEAAGYTAGQLMGMADEIGRSSGNIGIATEAMRELAASGRFAGQDLEKVGQIAVDMSALTGQSIQSAVSAIEKLQEDPVKAVAKLNDQYHFLTVAQFKEIEAAQQSGDAMRAASLAYEAMADKMNGRTDEMVQHANILVRSWREMKTVWSESMQEINHGLGGGDSSNALNEAKLLLATLEKQKEQAQEMGSSALPEITLEIQHQQKVVSDLTAEFKKQADAAASVGKAAQESAAQIDGMAKGHGKKHAGSTGHADHQQAQADRDAYNEQRLQHSMSLADEKAYWQAKMAAAKEGTDAYRQAVNELLQVKSKEASASKEEARQEVADAKHVAAEKIRAAKEVAREQQEAQRQARALSLESLKASHDQSTGEISNKRQQYQLEYDEGQISAAQLLQLEEQLATQKLAIDKKYYADKAKLDRGDTIAITKDDAGIVKAQQTAQAAMTAAEKEFHKNSEKEWQGYARKIEGAMQGAINGMLFQHQTLRQGVANVAMVMGEDFIQKAVMKPLDAWIAGEAEKIAASFFTHTSVEAQNAASDKIAIKQATASVSRAAGVAGANGVASFAAAPWPVDIGAPGFGVTMSIAAGSYAGLASAAGGWERVPFDGAMTELHRDEQVLPAHYAEGLRKLVSNQGKGGVSSNGGGDHLHFHMTDATGVKDLMRRHGRDIAAGARMLGKRGHRL